MSEASQTATHAAGHAENAGDHAEIATGAQCIDAAGGAPRRVTGGRGVQLDIFSRAPLLLSTEHYLGPIGGSVYEDAHGVIVCGHPSSRFLPQSWVELKRWCIGRPGVPNAGSMMWRGARRWIAQTFPGASTVVSYSDPSVGHTGALYRACGWLWAPTWHRLRPPPDRRRHLGRRDDERAEGSMGVPSAGGRGPRSRARDGRRVDRSADAVGIVRRADVAARCASWRRRQLRAVAAGGSVTEPRETDDARPVRGTWLVPPTTSADQRAELARDGAEVRDGWWLTVAVWTVDVT